MQVQAVAHNAPITVASQQAMMSCNAAVQSSHQDDQLSEASPIVTPIQPSEPLINPSAPTVSNPEPISSLSPVPAHLRDCIITGEYIDFNSLLTGAMFSTRDGPLTHQSTLPSLIVQMLAQNGGFQVTQAPTTTCKIKSFALWMEAWNYITFSQTITRS